MLHRFEITFRTSSGSVREFAPVASISTDEDIDSVYVTRDRKIVYYFYTRGKVSASERSVTSKSSDQILSRCLTVEGRMIDGGYEIMAGGMR